MSEADRAPSPDRAGAERTGAERAGAERAGLGRLAGAAFHGSPAAMTLTDIDGVVVATSRRFQELTGYGPGDISHITELSLPNDRVWTRTYIDQLVSGELAEYRTHKTLLLADGSELPASVVVRPLRADGAEFGDVEALIGLIEPLRPAAISGDRRLERLLASIEGEVMLLDYRGDLVAATGRHHGYLGYTDEYWETHEPLDVLVGESRDLARSFLLQLTENRGVSITEDFVVEAADGSYRTVRVTGTNHMDDPDVAGIVLTHRDVSDERRAIATLQRVRDDAVDEAERRSQLLAVVSHEMRTPLHSLTGLAELLATDDQLSESNQGLAGTLLRQLRQLASVTDDLLDATRVDTGSFAIRIEPYGLKRLIHDVVEVGAASARPTVEVVADIADGVPDMVMGDPARVQQLLHNLVGNALKFTDEGRVTVGVRVVGVDYELRVTDTGIGIPAEETSRVFEAFTTASTSGDRRGAGLGLAIVQRLVTSLGGTLSMRSELGEGTEITVSLPLVPTARSVTGVTPAAAPSKGRRALVVEDDDVALEVIVAQLERLGLDALGVSEADVAIELVAAGSTFDVVLIDGRLGDVTGPEVSRRLRSVQPELRIIAISGSMQRRSADEWAAAGVPIVVCKPASLDDLRGALAQVFGEVFGEASGDVLGELPSETEGETEGEQQSSTGDTDADAATALPEPEVQSAADQHHAGRPALDPAVLGGLLDELGGRAAVAPLVEMYLSELGARVDGILGGDEDTVRRMAHTLKSSSRLLGATEFGSTCEAIEHSGDVPPGFADACEQVRAAFSSWLDAEPLETPA